MGKTLDQLRASLARHGQRYITGTATGGTTATLIDTSGLARFTDDDALNGALLYISDTTDEQAPEGEARFVTDYTASSKTLTVSPAFSAAPGAGDTYELYLAPLQLEDWDQCINDAIKSAWPGVYAFAYDTITLTGAASYSLSTDAWGVSEVEIVPAKPVDALSTVDLPVTGESIYPLPQYTEEVLRVELAGAQREAGQILPEGLWYAEGIPSASPVLYLTRVPYRSDTDIFLRVTYRLGQPAIIPPELWSVSGTPGASLALALSNPLPEQWRELRVHIQKRYPEISGTTETDLDEVYIMAAARGFFYAMMADNAGAENARAGYLQLMAHWQEQAAQRKQELAAALPAQIGLGRSVTEEKEKKKDGRRAN